MSSIFQGAIAQAAKNHPESFIASLVAIAPNEASKIIGSLSLSEQSAVISRLPSWLFHQVIGYLEPEMLKASLNALNQTELVRLCASFSRKDLGRIKTLLDTRQLQKINGLEGHCQSTLLKMLNDEVVVCDASASIGRVQERLVHECPSQSSTLFIVDSNEQYVGAVSMQQALLHADKKAAITDLMVKQQAPLYVDMSENQIKKVHLHCILQDLPLCLESGVFLGGISNKSLSNYLLGCLEKNKRATPSIDTFFEAAGAGIGGLFEVLSGQLDNRSQL